MSCRAEGGFVSGGAEQIWDLRLCIMFCLVEIVLVLLKNGQIIP